VPGTGETHLCLSAAHSFVSEAYGSGGPGSDGYSFTGRYTLMPDTAPMAPPRRTAVPVVHGPQTAMVVGEGEIDCDEHGRILVRFHWDLEGAQSMRCRVSQNWAGNGWGGMVIPRIGMEVVVEFLEGDPDKPLVTGCVYNGRNAAPYALPANKTKAVWRSDSHEGEGFNEISFEDQGGRERIYVHAQHDHEVHVQNNRAKRVDVTEVESIGNSKYSEIGMDYSFQVGGNATTEIGASDVQLGATRALAAFDDGPLRLAYEATQKGGPDAARGHYTLIVAQSRTEAVGTQSTTRIGDSASLAVGTSYAMNVGARMSVTTGTDLFESVGGGRYFHVAKEIDLRCGASRLLLRSDGVIELTGVHIKLGADRIEMNE